MTWKLKCRDATGLASRAMDERLPLSNRMALRLHLAICDNCVRFNRQLQEMRRLFRAEPAAGDDAAGLPSETRQRHRERIAEKARLVSLLQQTVFDRR